MNEAKKSEERKMTNLIVRMEETDKNNLGDTALKLGFSRLEKGEVRGNASMLINLLARALPDKSAEEIKAFLFASKDK